MSLDNTAWISILSLLHREHHKEYTSLRTTASNDGTLLYTNSLDALTHLGSHNNCVLKYKTYRLKNQNNTCASFISPSGSAKEFGRRTQSTGVNYRLQILSSFQMQKRPIHQAAHNGRWHTYTAKTFQPWQISIRNFMQLMCIHFSTHRLAVNIT